MTLRRIRGIVDAVAVYSYGDSMCVRTGGGEVRCAGPSYAGDDAVAVHGAVEVTRIVRVDRLPCGVTGMGEYLCWIPGPSPAVVRTPELAGIRDVAHRCVVESDGRVSCWVPDAKLAVF